MNNDIQTGNIPVSISSPSTAAPEAKTTESGTGPAAQNLGLPGDSVSITSEVSRLQRLESELANLPEVNDTLVQEMSEALSRGQVDMDLQGIATKLIEMETGEPMPDKG